MLSVKIDVASSIAILEPNGPLSQKDFQLAAKVVDSHIENTGSLHGIVIHTESFPGWDSFAGLVSHLVFVKDHHKKIARLAFSTNSKLANFAEKIAGHFVSAEIKVFKYNELGQAKSWVAAREK